MRAAAKKPTKKTAPAGATKKATPAPPVESKKRGPKPKGTLTRDIVAAAGLATVDRDGFSGFSLRQVARELGILPNAVYTYARTRTELEQLVVDRIIAEADISLLDPDAGPWRERIEAYLQSLREALLAHPGAAPLLMATPLDGPHARTMGESLLITLMEAGLNGPDAARAVWPLLVQTFGAGRERYAAVDEDTYPNLYLARHVIARWPSNQQFLWGLRHFLDNLT